MLQWRYAFDSRGFTYLCVFHRQARYAAYDSEPVCKGVQGQIAAYERTSAFSILPYVIYGGHVPEFFVDIYFSRFYVLWLQIMINTIVQQDIMVRQVRTLVIL